MTNSPDRETRDRDQFLRQFLSNERELFRYVAVLVPNAGDAQEIVQQTALALWEKFDQYDPSRPFTPWACRFALNVARQWMARRRRWTAILDGNLAEQLLNRRGEMLPHMEARLRHLHRCMEKLPDDQRRIIDGYYFRQVGIESVAREARQSVDAVYKALQRIRRALRSCIERAVRLEDQPT